MARNTIAQGPELRQADRDVCFVDRFPGGTSAGSALGDVTRRTHVCLLYGIMVSGKLVYIGITTQPTSRRSSHQCRFPGGEFVPMRWYQTRRNAAAAEARSIRLARSWGIHLQNVIHYTVTNGMPKFSKNYRRYPQRATAAAFQAVMDDCWTQRQTARDKWPALAQFLERNGMQFKQK